MKVISLFASKGGVGKSTLTQQLSGAAYADGLKVAILDTDEQQSCVKWLGRRRIPGPDIVFELDPEKYSSRIEAFRAEGYDVVIVDTPGMDAPGPQTAAALSDLILIPSRPVQTDLETIAKPMAQIAALPKPVPYYVVLSNARVTAGSSHQEAIDQLEALGYEPASIHGAPTIHQRAVYEDAAKLGQTVAEVEPSGKAALETYLLWSWVASIASINK